MSADSTLSPTRSAPTPPANRIAERAAQSLLGVGQRHNVSLRERQVSTYSGAGLLALAFLGPRRTRPVAFLGAAALLYRGLTGSCPLYGALGIDSTHSGERGVPAQHGFRYEQSIAIQRSPEELYRRWRDLGRLPEIMRHLEQVVENGEGKSEWTAIGPLGVRLHWDAELIQDRQNELIAWQSLPGGDVDTAGSVHFRKLADGHGTAVDVSLKYNPPGGKVTAGLAWLLGVGAEARIDDDLRQFKSLLEAGETPTTRGQPQGPAARTTLSRLMPGER